MWLAIFRRLALLIPTILGATFFAFFSIRLIPGDPIIALAGEHGVSPERYEQLMAQFGFDRPLIVQYLDYLLGLLQGDFGVSFRTGTPVITEFLARFPTTIELAVLAMFFAITVGTAAGLIAACFRGKFLDYTVMGFSLFGYSMPIFWWGILLVLLFSNILGWTPVSGQLDFAYYVEPVTGSLLIDSLLAQDYAAFFNALHHLILPVLVLSTVPMAVIVRQVRSSVIDVLGEDYITAARAKGVSETRVVLVHALRNALMTVITTIGLQLGYLLGGAVLTETIFSLPGIGKWIIELIDRRDYFMLQGVLVIIALMIIAINLIVDLLYNLADPRIRLKR